MKITWPVYIVTLIVGVVSFALASWLPISEVMKGMAAVPGVVALLVFVGQILRDVSAHERARELLGRKQDFSLSIASHMAEVTFDKHFAFCEAYSETLHTGLRQLFALGPTDYALTLGDELKGIRAKYAVWLSDEIESSLFPIEQTLREIGAHSRVLKSMPVGNARTKTVETMYKFFGVVIGLERPMKDDEAEASATKILDKLRDILGIKELAVLRQRALCRAMQRTDE